MKVKIKSANPGGPVGNLDPGFFKYRQQQGNTISRAIQLQPYARHPFVYACVNAIAMNIARLPKLIHAKNKPDDVAQGHSITELLAKPNELISGTKIWELTLLYLLLPTPSTPGGQAFWFAVGKDGKPYDFQSRTGVPYYIYVYSDRFVSPVLNKEGSPNDGLFGWRLQLPNGQGATFKESEVLRFNLANPYDLFRGLSPLSAAWIALSGDGKANELNERFFDNNASLGGVLTTEQKMNSEQTASMAAQWRQEYSGTDNAGKVAVLHSGLSYQQIEGSHADMQYIEQKKMNREDIMAVYRVPKAEVALYEDINNATAISADKSFWEKTLVPYDMLILGVINNSWLRFYDGGKWQLKSDYTVIECLNTDYTAKLTAMIAAYAAGIPIAESARLLRVPVDTTKYPWLETWLVPYSMVPAGDVMEGASLDALSESGSSSEEESNKNMRSKKFRAQFKLKAAPLKQPSLEAKGIVDAIFKSIEKELPTVSRTRKEVEDYFERAIAPVEKTYRVSLIKYFAKQKNRILEAVDSYFVGKKSKAITKSDIPSDPSVFYENFRTNEDEYLSKISEEYFDKEIESQAKEMTAELGTLEDWEIDSKTMQKFKDRRLKKLKQINTTTFTAVGDQIRDAIENAPYEATPQELSKLIKDAIGKVYTVRKNQTMTIARTEIGTIASGTRNDIMKTEGIEQQEWIAYLDDATRPDHAAAHGEVRSLGEEFSTGLIYPLESGGEPEQVINCRCVVVPYFKSES